MLESLFNPDNPAMVFINKLIDLVTISIVWTIFCIPIVTIGPSCAALYYAVVKSIRRERGHIVREFWTAFKSNFKHGLIFELIWLAFAFMMFVTDVPLFLTFIDTGKTQDTIMLVLFVIKVLLLIGIACWIYPIMSRFDQSLWKLSQTSLIVMVQNLPRTIFSIILVTIIVLLLVSEPLYLVFLPGLMVLLLSFLTEPVLKQMCETAEGTSDNSDEWYLE